jgi:hypothetical protein
MLAGLQNKAASPTKLDPRGQLRRAGGEEAGEQQQEQPAAAAAPAEQQPAVTQGECASKQLCRGRVPAQPAVADLLHLLLHAILASLMPALLLVCVLL